MSGANGAKLRIEYARGRLKKLHAEMIMIEEKLRGDLSRETRELLDRAKRSRVQSAARWAEMIIDLEMSKQETL